MLSTLHQALAFVSTTSNSSPAASVSPSTIRSLSTSPLTTPPVEPDPCCDEDLIEASGFFRRLQARGSHSSSRIQQIRKAALRDLPPTEPPQYACCGSSCGIDCVVTIWWEEEKTWRDCHEDWKEIKERLAAEEEESRRLEQEEEALGGPAVAISIDEEGGSSSDSEQQGLARALASVEL